MPIGPTTKGSIDGNPRLLDDRRGNSPSHVVAPAEGRLGREHFTPGHIDRVAVELALPDHTQFGIAILHTRGRLGEVDLAQHVLQREGGELCIGRDVDLRDGQRIDQREAQRHVDRDIAAQSPVIVEHVPRQAELRARQKADDVLRGAGDRQPDRRHLRRWLVQSRQVDRAVGDRQVDRVAALHVEMNRPALVPGLAGHVPDLGHVRHVAHAQPAIVEEGRHPVDLQVCNIADGRTQGELRRQVDGAAAHVGERPLPASFGKAQRPVVAQPVDGDLPDLGAAGEMALLVRAPPRPRDHDLGGSEIEIDPIDLRGVLHIVDAELRRHGMDLMGRRQDARQGDAAVVAADVDGDVPDLSIAGPVDQKPPSQGDIDPRAGWPDPGKDRRRSRA